MVYKALPFWCSWPCSGHTSTMSMFRTLNHLQKSTKIYKYLGSCMFGYAWNCLDLIQNDQILKSYKILNSRSYAAMLEKSACLHCRVFMWNPLETSLFRRLEAKTCKLQTCCVDSTIPYGRIMVQWQYHMWNQALPWPSKNWQESNAGTGSAQEILEVSRSDLKSPSQASMVAVHRNKVYSMGM